MLLPPSDIFLRGEELVTTVVTFLSSNLLDTGVEVHAVCSGQSGDEYRSSSNTLSSTLSHGPLKSVESLESYSLELYTSLGFHGSSLRGAPTPGLGPSAVFSINTGAVHVTISSETVVTVSSEAVSGKTEGVADKTGALGEVVSDAVSL